MRQSELVAGAEYLVARYSGWESSPNLCERMRLVSTETFVRPSHWSGSRPVQAEVTWPDGTVQTIPYIRRKNRSGDRGEVVVMERLNTETGEVVDVKIVRLPNIRGTWQWMWERVLANKRIKDESSNAYRDEVITRERQWQELISRLIMLNINAASAWPYDKVSLSLSEATRLVEMAERAGS